MNREQDVDRLFIHGAGRRGADAWPGFASGDFLEFPATSTIDAQVDMLIHEHSARRSIVFAHSIGAVPAVLAAATGRMNIVGLVLVEPALYDISRGSVSIERHIGIVSEARAQASAGDLRGFWRILRPLMFGGRFDAAKWNAERPLAERWASTNPPWGHGVRPSALTGVPTLVVTGGWNDEYEAIAAVLAAHGAEHHVVRGAGHRAQDMAEFGPIVDRFLRRTMRDDGDASGESHRDRR
ncbi:hypothetical protein SRABI76_00065 [Microbacterium oxydans]|uniref:alpha/beta fold hydrolase n=1 Tax=Microbacterium oxydans TaxID=82380 RepID=UPI001D5AAC22|nr:alpha/beta fold hydrolase [Microbacterium oxydans]CAH0123826.1 hypothetical protein SRABI76_00065 [Microbacterium oxydans]